MKIGIKAIEYYLPSRTEDGNMLKKDNPDWRIEEMEGKTGISVRHISDVQQTAVDMAVIAAEKLFDNGVNKEEIDFLILITQSPDYILPTSACILQDVLGLKKSCMAFDVNLGCSGFIYGLAIGGALSETGFGRKGLVVCSETYTKYIDKSDRICRPLFSDGSAAALLGPTEGDHLGPFEMGTDGSGFEDLIVREGGSRIFDEKQDKRRLSMDGAKVFMFTMDMVPKCVTALLEKSRKTIDDIDLFVFHQANKMVLNNIADVLEIPREKVFINSDRVGNTVSASIPIALKDAVDAHSIKKGDLLMLVGFGVGYSWGGCLIKWGEE
jgi:3-oxoacyl-[acyl-carrier-protein] synthase-3